MANHEWFKRIIRHKEEEITALENHIKKLEAEIKELREQDETENGKKQILLEVVE